MASNDLYLDKRLQEKSLRNNKLTAKELDGWLGKIKDTASNLFEFDEEGNPTNELERELKTLPMKAADPELYEPELPPELPELTAVGID